MIDASVQAELAGASAADREHVFVIQTATRPGWDELRSLPTAAEREARLRDFQVRALGPALELLRAEPGLTIRGFAGGTVLVSGRTGALLRVLNSSGPLARDERVRVTVNGPVQAAAA
jgi:hypothetical protein